MNLFHIDLWYEPPGMVIAFMKRDPNLMRFVETAIITTSSLHINNSIPILSIWHISIYRYRTALGLLASCLVWICKQTFNCLIIAESLVHICLSTFVNNVKGDSNKWNFSTLVVKFEATYSHIACFSGVKLHKHCR